MLAMMIAVFMSLPLASSQVENFTFLETVSSKGEYNIGIKVMYI